MAKYGLHSAFQCQPSDPPRVTAKGGGRRRIKGIVCFEPHFCGCSLELCIGFKEVLFISTDFAGTSSHIVELCDLFISIILLSMAVVCCLLLVVSSEDAGEGEKVELCLGGADRYVNEENKMQYLEAGTHNASVQSGWFHSLVLQNVGMDGTGAATLGTMKII